MIIYSDITTYWTGFHDVVGDCNFGKIQLVDYQYVFKSGSSTTFTGKELDSETGYSYFGARYYDAELSGLFFSVDPMSDKYPNISPYIYCMWNPIKILDPAGNEIVLVGDLECKEKAIAMMSSILGSKSKISFHVDEQGRVSYSGYAKTEIEEYMINIIDNKEITVNLTVQESNKDNNGYEIYGGSFDGNKFKSESKDGVNAYQTVDLITANINDLKVGEAWKGQTIWHEISEAFEAGVLSIDKGIEAQKAYDGEPNMLYDSAHKIASTHFPASPKAIIESYQIGMIKHNIIVGYEFE